MARLGTCKSCGGPILWAETAAGKAMPLDPEPSARGTVRLTLYSRAEVVPAAHRDGQTLYTSHFATCPNAAQHRKGN